jgi:hypothetical protein
MHHLLPRAPSRPHCNGQHVLVVITTFIKLFCQPQLSCQPHPFRQLLRLSDCACFLLERRLCPAAFHMSLRPFIRLGSPETLSPRMSLTAPEARDKFCQWLVRKVKGVVKRDLYYTGRQAVSTQSHPYADWAMVVVNKVCLTSTRVLLLNAKTSRVELVEYTWCNLARVKSPQPHWVLVSGTAPR